VNGHYQEVREARRGEMLMLNSLPGFTVGVADLLG
jgi:hypothetical protein